MKKRKKQRLQKQSEQRSVPQARERSLDLPTSVESFHSANPDEVARSLTAIYDGQPSKEWLNTLERGKRKTWLIVLVSFLGVMSMSIAAAWLGFWWLGGRGFNGNGVQIQIEGPDQVSIGQEVSYFINWYNVSREPLAASEFRVSFPNDFILSSVDPQPTNESLVFRLGAQPMEARGTIKVTGMFTGALGTKSAVQVIGTYRPASFNSDFEELATKEIVYSDSVLDGVIEAPPRVMPGDEITISYKLKNTGAITLNGLRVRFELPRGFVRSDTTSTASIDESYYIVSIDPLAAGEEVIVDLTGSFSVGSGGDIPITVESGYLVLGDIFAAAERTEATIPVLAGDLNVDVVINGTQDDRFVSVGEWQSIGVSYANTSGERLNDIALAILVEPVAHEETTVESTEFIDWNALDDERKGIHEGNRLTFTSEEIEEFKALEPSADGYIEISIPILASIKREHDVPLQVSVEASIGSVAGQEVNRLVRTKPITLTLQSDASIRSIARFTSDEGAPIGSGPLPPVVGSTTTYRVEWLITKTLHDLESITVSAQLPGSALWQGQKFIDAGVVEYDAATKLVSWTINRMPEDVDNLLLSFDVSVRPSEADVGRFVDLLGETRLEFVDTKLKQTILRTASSLNSDLSDDALAERKGVVSRE